MSDIIKQIGVVYILPVGESARSSFNIEKIFSEKVIKFPLIEGMPTQHNHIKNIRIGMKILIIKRNFKWDDIPIGIGVISDICEYNEQLENESHFKSFGNSE